MTTEAFPQTQAKSNFLSVIMKNTFLVLIVSSAIFNMLSNAYGETASSVTQYGITWKFDKEYQVGKFITGDYWVVGPVKVVSVTPTPGPAPKDEPNMKGYPFADLKTMRNGSMIVLKPKIGYSGPDKKYWLYGFVQQGYDSRLTDYVPVLSTSFPCDLLTNQSLISTISSEKYEDGKLQTPNVLAEMGIFDTEKKDARVTETAAVLTCLDKEPPADAFRPPYAGTEKPIYQAKDIHWDLLPRLKPVPSTPDWEKIERIFERPWIDTHSHHLIIFTAPAQNQPGDGREFARMTSYAALMLLLDVSKEKKTKLMYHYLQLGIDLSGLAKCGRSWEAEGTRFQGRKWPILFASIMLDKPEIRAFPTSNPNAKNAKTDNVPPPTTLFSEDMDTYYGKIGDGPTRPLFMSINEAVTYYLVGYDGQKSIWRTGRGGRDSHQPEKEVQDTGEKNGLVHQKYAGNASSWVGTALAALYMKGKSIWDHDAFFDHEDFWMSDKNTIYSSAKWAPKGCSKTIDLFVEEMWNAYRKDAPGQPGGKDNLKWIWDQSGGHFVQNSPEK